VENEVRIFDKIYRAPHKNIVAVLDYGYLSGDNNYFFLDMELCERSLDDHIRDHIRPASENELIPSDPTVSQARIKKSMNIMLNIAEGVSYIHRQGEVHRDLKPENGVIYS
jgi:serine/threonine protein kinase